ncbi:hypothetical protein Cfor_02749 [Coptotermes formosanus]|jgi:small ubiquitin-related modifier|uniref:Ubiquitin-like domain-containing protein n=1 Tax=Coptotermes formosanus TaxID=36987 RepID=A0A6L2QB45_COPFO|nr:hypothetical protein Cfor_02749 [Coptotermes formosanus]
MSNHNKAEDVRGSEAEYITLTILGQDNAVSTFRVMRSRPLGRLMHNYCNWIGIDEATVRFLYDGQRIRKTDTPLSLEMAEDDTIEVYWRQVGGRGPYTCRNLSKF